MKPIRQTRPTLPLAAVASIALLATAAATTSAWAGGDSRADRAHVDEHVMQAIANPAAAGEPGEGWRYFSDARAHRAVVIAPQGEYYFSRGKGLRQVMPQPLDAAERGMQVVEHAAARGEPGEGWRYFSDVQARRAVVISPEGDYYFSRGKGLRLVAAAQARA